MEVHRWKRKEIRRMSEVLVWVKTAVRLCMSEFETDEEERDNFAKMEQLYNQYTDAEQRQIRKIIKTQFEVNDKIYIFSVLAQRMEIEDFQGDFMESILEGSFDGYTGSMLEWVSLVHVKGEYRRKRIFHKNFIYEKAHVYLLPLCRTS